MKNSIRHEDHAPYITRPNPADVDPGRVIVTPKSELMAADDIIRQALAILEDRLADRAQRLESPWSFTSATLVKDYLRLKLADEEAERFTVLFLDTQHRLISADTLFYGTLDGASVYPREVVKSALAHNAAAVILAHNHPSGETKPSRADHTITAKLKAALALVGVRILDHLIVGAGTAYSMAEQGQL